MKKIEMINIVATKAHLPKKAAREAVEVFLAEIQRAISKGEKVVLSGFGTFKSTFVDDKAVVYPKTKEKKVVKGHRAARFTPGRGLKKAVK